jgi:hypothetical protein
MRGVRRTSVFAALLAVVLILGASAANAATLTFTATLTGAQEVPPSGSAGTGTATVTWDTTTNLMTVNVSFSGLGSTTTASHIHCCAAAGVNAMVATAVPTFPGFPLGVTSGTYLMTFDMTLASSYNPAFITAHGGTVSGAMAALLAGLQAGQAYLNIHTAQFPGGEIRGQLQTPTAVQLARFTATRSGRDVRLRWWTGSDSGMLGFNVYRGAASRRTRVTRRLIPATGRVAGATYSWVEHRGHGSRYWLQIVGTDGSKSWYGPARVS